MANPNGLGSEPLLDLEELLLGSIDLPDFPAALLIAAGTLMMLLYDYIYTLILNFYINRIQRKGGDSIKLS